MSWREPSNAGRFGGFPLGGGGAELSVRAHPRNIAADTVTPCPRKHRQDDETEARHDAHCAGTSHRHGTRAPQPDATM